MCCFKKLLFLFFLFTLGLFKSNDSNPFSNPNTFGDNTFNTEEIAPPPPPGDGTGDGGGVTGTGDAVPIDNFIVILLVIGLLLILISKKIEPNLQ